MSLLSMSYVAIVNPNENYQKMYLESTANRPITRRFNIKIPARERVSIYNQLEIMVNFIVWL